MVIIFVKEFYLKIIDGNFVEMVVQKVWFKLCIEKGYEVRDFVIFVVFMNVLDGYLFVKEFMEIIQKKNGFLSLMGE